MCIKWLKVVKTRKSLPLTSFETIEVNKSAEVLGDEFFIKNLKVEANRSMVDVFIDIDEAKEIEKKVIEKINKDENFLKNIAEKCYYYCDDYMKNSKDIFGIDLKNKTNEDLLRLFVLYNEKFSNFAPFLFFPHYIENYLTTKVIEGLKKTFPLEKEEKIQDYFMILTTVQKESNPFLQQKDFLEIAILSIEKKLDNPEVINRIERHAERFGWMACGASLLDHPWSKDFIIKKVEEIENPIENLKRLENKRTEEINTYESFIKKLDKNLIKDAEILQEYMYLRFYRFDTLREAQNYIKPLLKEISRRFCLNYEDLVWFIPPEIEKLITDGLKPELNQRKISHIILREKGKIELKITFLSKVEINFEGILKGNIANKGIAEGIVKVIKDVRESEKVNKGDILVTSMTCPDMIFAMEKAAAIVTDEGGILCHAAILSRELGKPCLIATKIATNVLKDGDRVRVDAENGIIEKL